jgi:selenocysteine lyase/cysteine desulfurase
VDEALKRWRADTPGCGSAAHLNNAGAGLMPAPVVDAVVSHLQREALEGGYEAGDAASEQVQDAYAQIAALLGTAPRHVALVENATVAFNQALSSFDLQPGDVIVTTRADYISSQLAFLALARRRGVVVRRAADLPEGGVDPQSVRELLRDPRVRLVSVTWVPNNSGLVQPVAEVGAVCEERGVPYLVDACQALGQMPVDVAALRCDYLAATARKFLRGPRGIGCLYVSERALQRGDFPLHVDMRGAHWTGADTFELAPDARRFENWEFAYALVLGFGAAARYALTIGLDEIRRRSRALAEQARAGLQTLPGARLLDRGRETCAIVSVAFAGRDDTRPLVRALRARGVRTGPALRAFALIDMDDKGAPAALRVSPHYYNTPEEIQRLVSVLREVLAAA